MAANRTTIQSQNRVEDRIKNRNGTPDRLPDSFVQTGVQMRTANPIKTQKWNPDQRFEEFTISNPNKQKIEPPPPPPPERTTTTTAPVGGQVSTSNLYSTPTLYSKQKTLGEATGKEGEEREGGTERVGVVEEKGDGVEGEEVEEEEKEKEEGVVDEIQHRGKTSETSVSGEEKISLSYEQLNKLFYFWEKRRKNLNVTAGGGGGGGGGAKAGGVGKDVKESRARGNCLWEEIFCLLIIKTILEINGCTTLTSVDLCG